MPISPIERRILTEIKDDLTAELESKRDETIQSASELLERPDLNIHQFHAIIGRWNTILVDAVRLQFADPNDFIARWLKGLKNKVQEYRESKQRGGTIQDGMASLELLRLVQNEVVRDYIFTFLRRNFFRNLIERTRAKPKDHLWELWFGDNKMVWGIFIAPDFRDDEWRNDKSEIRRASYDYWTIGHILSTGLIDPDSNRLIKFSTAAQLIDFYRSVLKRVSNSFYEKAIADRYALYLENSNDVESEPFLIPELRYAGLESEHFHRLDYAVLNPHVMDFTGFELSPHSTHMAVTGIKAKTQKAVNEELLAKWEKEMGKRNDYFCDFDISTVTFTDAALQNIDQCFAQIADHLSARPDEPVSVDYQLAEIISL